MFEHNTVKRLPARIPYAVLLPMLMIVGIGILNLSSAARATRPELYLNQLARFSLAVVLMAGVSLVHTRILRRLSYLAFVSAILMLLLVLAIGTTAKGAERWLVLGALRIQPSDPAKLALILAMARYCSIYWPHKGYSLISLIRPLNISRPLGFLISMVFLLRKSHHGLPIFSDQLLTSRLGMGLMILCLACGFLWLLLSIFKLYRQRFDLKLLIAPLDIPLILFLLIAIEPDLGTGLIVLAIAGIMLLFVGIRRSSLILGGISILLVGVGAYFTLLKDYQRQRIISFLNPEADIRGEGYHAMQSIIAIGSGRVTGKGYSGGTQTQLSFLPENATDFVFSVWAEEWGFVASIFLLGLYSVLLYSILKIAGKVTDEYSQLICVGVAAFIFLHVLINVGMVTGLMPVVGVPLPLMSFGGSSMNVTMIGIGLVINVAIWRGEQ